MSYKKRIETLELLSGWHRCMGNSSKLSNVRHEFNSISATSRLSTNKGWLLAVLHTTRALDTILSEVLLHKHWTTTSHSIGGYLKKLDQQGILFAGERDLYQKRLVDKRNKYMHEAGAMPQKKEADQILNEMHTLLTSVLGRL